MPGSVTSVFGEPDDFQAALGEDGVLGMLITGRGRFRAQLTQITLHRLRLSAAEEHLPRIVFVAVPADAVLVPLPIGGGPSPIWGGIGMRADEIITLGPDQRVRARSGGSCCWGTIRLPARDLARYGRALSGARWGYRLLPLLLGLIPVLYMVQELALRLGIFTGRGYSELVRHHFGHAWAWVSAAGLAVAVAGSMITEFAAVAGIGELYGISRNLTLPLAASTLLVIVLSGSYRRVERTAILIGSFELAFLLVAATMRPDFATVAHDLLNIPLGSNDFWLLGAALIGAVFNPWMVFYQQSAMAEKQLDHRHYDAARWDTALGAVLTQVVSASVLFVAATTFGSSHAQASLDSVGQISEALTPHLGATVGRLVFSLGVLGASIVAAIVCSLACLGAR